MVEPRWNYQVIEVKPNPPTRGAETMLHVVKLAQRRFPQHADRIVTTLITLSTCALVLGAGLLLLGTGQH